MNHSVITRVQAKVVCLPLKTPVAIATRVVTERFWLLVKISTADGVSGLGFAYVGYENGNIAEQVVDRFLTPMLLGTDSTETSAIWLKIVKACHFFGTDGLMMRCISAVDIALWDRNAKAIQVPLFHLLNVQIEVQASRELPVYVGAGYYTSGSGVEEIRALKRAGFNAVKVKVGRLAANEEATRVQTFKNALGADVELIVDANGAWSDISGAKSIVRLFEEIGVSTIEDPFPPNRLKDYADLRRGAKAKIAAGELYGSPQQFYTAFDFGAIDIPQIDATVCGGVTAFLALAKFYESRQVKFETHWFPELHVHLAQLSRYASRIEVFANDETINFGQIVNSLSRLSAKGAMPSTDFGHGVSLKNSALFF
jgi:L-alanine-DL-glutamate epimerase-like enolase superfamily enzyme